MTKIAWTDESLSPLAGCQMVSPGCANCYAMTVAGSARLRDTEKYRGVTKQVNGRAVWTGEVRLVEKELEKLYHWKKPRRVFMASMADMFHDAVPFDFLDRVMQAIADNPRHTVQILTKRAERMAEYLQQAKPGTIPANIWFGVSAEDQQRADERIPYFKYIPWENPTFVSYEPALGPIQWNREWVGTIDQIIVGAESGTKPRPFDMQWARDTWSFCLEYRIAMFFKQQPAFKSGVNPWLEDEAGRRWRIQQYPGQLTIPEELTA